MLPVAMLLCLMTCKPAHICQCCHAISQPFTEMVEVTDDEGPSPSPPPKQQQQQPAAAAAPKPAAKPASKPSGGAALMD